jgi:hypothetical protein
MKWRKDQPTLKMRNITFFCSAVPLLDPFLAICEHLSSESKCRFRNKKNNVIKSIDFHKKKKKKTPSILLLSSHG